MAVSLDVALSAQAALMKRLETIAHNVANATTVGFRAEEVSFETVLSQQTGDQTSFASAGETTINRNSGPLVETGNPLDIAVRGDGWLAIQTEAGIAHTRDGRMQMLATGELRTLAGHPVLDVGQAPIVLDPQGGPAQIAPDGMITQGDRQVGAVGLFRLDEEAVLTRFENSGFLSDRPARPILDFTGNGVAQGFVEQSNVNPVLQMTKLIAVSRSYESLSNAVNGAEDSRRDAIRTLGETS